MPCVKLQPFPSVGGLSFEALWQWNLSRDISYLGALAGRNIPVITRGGLDDWRGKQFKIGDVVFEGLPICGDSHAEEIRPVEGDMGEGFFLDEDCTLEARVLTAGTLTVGCDFEPVSDT